MQLSRLSAWLLMGALLAGGASCDKLGLGGGDPSAKAESDEEDAPKARKKKKKGDDDEAPKAPTATAQLTFQAPTAPTGPGVPLGPNPTQPAVASVDYFGVDAVGIPTKFKARFPQGARVIDIKVYPTYIFAEVQDAAQKTHVDQYQLREGFWRDPTPVKPIRTKSEGAIDTSVFDVNEVAFSELAKLAKDAPARLKVETPTVSHMVINRPLPFDKEVRIRVFVDGPRSNGYVDYDKKGTFLKAHD